MTLFNNDINFNFFENRNKSKESIKNIMTNLENNTQMVYRINKEIDNLVNKDNNYRKNVYGYLDTAIKKFKDEQKNR